MGGGGLTWLGSCISHLTAKERANGAAPAALKVALHFRRWEGIVEVVKVVRVVVRKVDKGLIPASADLTASTADVAAPAALKVALHFRGRVVEEVEGKEGAMDPPPLPHLTAFNAADLKPLTRVPAISPPFAPHPPRVQFY